MVLQRLHVVAVLVEDAQIHLCVSAHTLLEGLDPRGVTQGLLNTIENILCIFQAKKLDRFKFGEAEAVDVVEALLDQLLDRLFVELCIVSQERFECVFWR